MAVITEEQKFVCKNQPIRNEIVKIYILNKNNLIISEISGKVIEGSISLDATSFIRRSGTLKLILDSETTPSQTNYLWVTNRCKISIGIQNLLTNQYCWFNMGTFLFKDLTMNYSSSDKTISLNLLDPMCQFSGDLGGTLENDIKIANMGVTISQAIKSVVVDLGNESENNVLISDIVDSDTGISRTLPYTLTKTSGSNLLDVIKELTQLYKYTQSYYNELGQFVCEPTKTLLSSDISEDFSDVDFTISSQVTNDFSYIKNFVKVVGVSVTPLVSVADVSSTSNPNPINNSTALKITFNKALYDSSGTEIADNIDLKNYFNYSGTSTNFVSAIYDKDTWSIVFNIVGENGKILSPKSNMLYDSSAIAYTNDGYTYSSTDSCWGKLLTASIVTDGVNNQTKFELHFNKPLYTSSRTKITTGTDLKNTFTYSGGISSNFVSAIYTIDSEDYYVTLTFASAISYSVIQINKDGSQNSNSVYDSAGLIYDTREYLMNGETWTIADSSEVTVSTTQVIAIASNTDNTSEYSIDNIGKKVLVITDSTVYTPQQATVRAQYELQLHSNMNETISLNCIPLYYMDVNTLIFLSIDEMGVNGKYRIDKISIDLKQKTMSLTCVKLYY